MGIIHASHKVTLVRFTTDLTILKDRLITLNTMPPANTASIIILVVIFKLNRLR